ncbi:hypothetical protein Vretimale_4298, partial [Volvox reticuliferus]
MAIAEILRLGTDTLLLVLQHLDAESLAKFCCTCRNLKSAAETPALWRALANERWYRVHAASFPQPRVEPSGPANTKANSQPSSDNVTDWKSLFASGNGWEPPRLHHTGKLYRSGIRALQALYHEPDDISGDNPTTENSGADGWLLALGRDAGLDVWHFSPAAFSDGGGDTGGAPPGSSGPANGVGGRNNTASTTIGHYAQPPDSNPPGFAGSISDRRPPRGGGNESSNEDEGDAGQPPDRACRSNIR